MICFPPYQEYASKLIHSKLEFLDDRTDLLLFWGLAFESLELIYFNFF